MIPLRNDASGWGGRPGLPSSCVPPGGQARGPAPLFAAAMLLTLCAAVASAQVCSCGANPPVPPNRTLEPYANTPEDLEPFSKFTEPYFKNYTKTPEYNGAARDAQAAGPAGAGRTRRL